MMPCDFAPFAAPRFVSRDPALRRRQSAAERRQQHCKAEGRALQRCAGALASIAGHRCNRRTLLGQALAAALDSVRLGGLTPGTPVVGCPAVRPPQAGSQAVPLYKPQA